MESLSEALNFFFYPFLLCLLLVGIHCYLGLHVLKRGIIFIDLSLAQIASLGTTAAMLYGLDPDGPLSYIISLAHTVIAAAIFSYARHKEGRISQEVVIGLAYALSSALVVLFAFKLSHGAEHIKEILTGRILWVTSGDVLKTAIIYGAVAIIHVIFFKQMWQSTLKEKNSPFWDFLFFALFGVVITSSVHVAGILLVFSLLIVPALLGTLLTKSDPPFTFKKLAIGWGIGSLVSFIGMILSYTLDLPVGAMTVVLFTAIPFLLLPFLKGIP